MIKCAYERLKAENAFLRTRMAALEKQLSDGMAALREKAAQACLHDIVGPFLVHERLAAVIRAINIDPENQPAWDRARASLHDEERPNVAEHVAHAEALVAQAGRSLKALEEKTGVTMHDEEQHAPPLPAKDHQRAVAVADRFEAGGYAFADPFAPPRCTPMRCRAGLDFHHCEEAGHLAAAQGEEK